MLGVALKDKDDFEQRQDRYLATNLATFLLHLCQDDSLGGPLTIKNDRPAKDGRGKMVIDTTGEINTVFEEEIVALEEDIVR